MPSHDDRSDGGSRFEAHFDLRMEELGEDFQAGDQARSGTGEIAVGVERINVAVSHRGNIAASPAGKSIERYSSRACSAV